MERLWENVRYLIQRFLEEKFKAFRSGVVAGGLVCLPFLFSMQGLSRDLIWLFPLKLLMCSCFSFCTGLASLGAKSAFSYLRRRWVIKVRRAKAKIQKNSDKAA
jgi:hypothetical protein